MKFKKVLSLLVAIIFVILGAGTPALFAQGTDLGTIQGTVTDSTGAVVPNAQVQVLDTDTGQTFPFTTNSHGWFSAADIQAGHYKVTVDAQGFATAIVDKIILQGTMTQNLHPVLHVVSATTTVHVTSAANLINTQNATVSQTLTPKDITQLPRDSRDIYQFLYINPNIQGSDEPGDFKFAGSQSYGASFSVDGQRTNGGIFGSQTQSQPSLEAVGSLQVLSSGYSAEYAGVANIRVTTKSGTDKYHGSAYYDNVNSALSAWTLADKLDQETFSPTPFQPTFARPHSNDTDMAFSFGGPVPKLKNTWIFAAYEENWGSFPTTESGNIPGPLLQQGDFSQLTDAAKPNVPSDVVLSPQEIATDTVGGLGHQFIRIPSRLINPVTSKLINLYFPKIGTSALVNSTTGKVSGYQTAVPARGGQRNGDLRIDHQINNSNRFYGVYHASAQNTISNPVAAPYTGLGLLNTNRLNNMVSLSYTHVFSPNMVNEARGGFNIQHLYTHANTTLQSFLSNIGFSTADIAAYTSVVGTSELPVYGNTVINFGSGYSKFNTGGRSSDRKENQNLITFGDTLTWIFGRHTLKFGGDFVRNQAVDGFASTRGNPLGSLTYKGNGRQGIANFLLGEAPYSATSVYKPRPPLNVHNWEDGFFVQDDFKPTQKLTFNFGLRYDIFTPFVEANDLLVNFDPNYTNPANGNHGRFVIPSNKALPYLSPGLINYGVVTASQSGLGTGPGLVRLDKNDWAPRIGFAYSLSDKNVIRGGWGMFYPTSAAQADRDAIGTNSFNQVITRTSTPQSPLSRWPTGGETTGVSPNIGGVAIGQNNEPSANYIPVNLKNPRLQMWNLTFERELPKQSSIRVSYLGAHEAGDIMGIDLAMLVPSNNAFGTSTDPTGTLGYGDGQTPCDPSGNQANGDPCLYSKADLARMPFPILGDYILGYGNVGVDNTNSFQAQFLHQATHFTFSIAYTLQHQDSSGIDMGNSSLAGEAYNGINPTSDYGPASWVSRNRVVAFGIYDLPVGRGERFGGNMPSLLDAFIGGWQITSNMFAKSGVPFTPYLDCTDCDPVVPGNVGTGSMDAIGNFNSTSIRPLIISDPRKNVPKGYQWNPAAFALPTDIGAGWFTQPNLSRRNSLTGPGSYGVNIGVHKIFHANRFAVEIGADLDNAFNHPMRSPDQNYAYSGSENGPSYAALGSFNQDVDQNTPPPGKQPALLPLNTDYTPNEGATFGNFGQNYQTFEEEGISGNRVIRLKGRISF